MPDFETRVEVLQSLGYLDEDRTVTLKGRVACEIATGDELVGTEIIFAGVLTHISPEEAVALLAALVFQEKNSSHLNFMGRSLRHAKMQNSWHLLQVRNSCAEAFQWHRMSLSLRRLIRSNRSRS